MSETPFKDIYAELAVKINDETAVWSGGYHRSKQYRDLKGIGVGILPFLVEEIRSPGTWWRMQMVCEISETSLGQCIYFPPEIRGKLEPVQEKIEEWWSWYLGNQTTKDITI